MAKSDLVPWLETSPAEATALFRESLHQFDAVRFRVTGACMLPVLAPGDVVRLKEAARARPRFGDVLLVSTPDGPRLHRLVWRPPFGPWRTRGDQAPGFDGPLHPQSTLGAVVGVEREEAVVPVFSRGRALVSLVRGILLRVGRGWIRP
jgi:hypothetical protein